MKRTLFTMIVVAVALGTAVLVAAKATHVYYNLQSENFFMDDPMLYVAHEADGWLIFQGVPIGGNYARQMDGVDVLGALSLEASGKMSVDFADGNVHGPVTLVIEVWNVRAVSRPSVLATSRPGVGSFNAQTGRGSTIHGISRIRGWSPGPLRGKECC